MHRHLCPNCQKIWSCYEDCDASNDPLFNDDDYDPEDPESWEFYEVICPTCEHDSRCEYRP